MNTFLTLFYVAFLSLAHANDMSLDCRLAIDPQNESKDISQLIHRFSKQSKMKLTLKKFPILSKEQQEELLLLESLVKKHDIKTLGEFRERKTLAIKRKKEGTADEEDFKFMKVSWNFNTSPKIKKLWHILSKKLLFEDFKEFVRAHPDIIFPSDYKTVRLDPALIDLLPSNPHTFYEEWTSWGDVLVGEPLGEFLTLEESIPILKKYGFKNIKEFHKERRQARKRYYRKEATKEDMELLRIPSFFYKYWDFKDYGGSITKFLKEISGEPKDKFLPLEEGILILKKRGFKSLKEFQTARKQAKERYYRREASAEDLEILKIHSHFYNHWDLTEYGGNVSKFLSELKMKTRTKPKRKIIFLSLEEGILVLTKWGIKSIEEFKKERQLARQKWFRKEAGEYELELLLIPADIRIHWDLKKYGGSLAQFFKEISQMDAILIKKEGESLKRKQESIEQKKEVLRF